MAKEKISKAENRRVIAFALALFVIAVFVGAAGYTVVYNNDIDTAFFNQTNMTSTFGISLLKNATGYNFTSGDFKSFVFYNTTQPTFWNITLGISCRNLTANITCNANTNITLQTRTANSYNISDSGLVALWGLNNRTGENATYFIDETGRYNATCPAIGGVCPTLTSNGTIGNSMKFSGTTSGITTTLAQIRGNVTYSAWINYPAADIADYNWIVGLQSTNYDRVLTEITTGYAMFDFKIATVYTVVKSTKNVVDGKWHHIVATRNNTQIVVYVDGILSASAAGGTADVELAMNYTIGYENNLGSPFYVPSGVIDEIRIYNRSLNITEVQNLYNLGSYHFVDWSSWSAESVVNDNIPLVSETGGNFMQFKANFFTNNTLVSPYLLNHSVTASLNSPVLNITYPLNITYSVNVTQINYTISGASQTCWYSLDGGITNTTINCGTNITNLNGIGGSRTWGIYANNTLGALGSVVITFFSNSLPTIISVALNSTDSTKNDTSQNLTGRVTVVDIDGDNITYVYTWYKKNVTGSFIDSCTLLPNTTGLVNYYPLDNDAFDYWRSNDGIITEATLNTSGKVGGTYQFDGSNDKILSQSNLGISSNMPRTISFWAKPDTLSADKTMVSFGSNVNNQAFDIIIQYAAGANNLYLYNFGGDISGASGLVLGEWRHYAVTYNGSNMYLWVNGTFLTNGNRTLNTANTQVTIGGAGLVGAAYDGAIDEVQIYNRSLNATEIYQLYLGGNWGGNTTHSSRLAWNDTWILGIKIADYFNGFTNETNSTPINITDLTVPNATLNTPVNASYLNNATQNLTATLTDESSGVKNATLFVYNLTSGANQLINQTDLTGFVAGTLSTSVGIVVNFVDGIYNWFYSLFDFAGNKFTGGNNTLTIDTTFPVIAYGTNMAVNKANLSQNWTFVNITLTEINLANLTYNIVNNTGTVNQTNYTSAILTINWTNLPDTNYSYWVNVTDLAGNRNSTPVRTITLDKTAPNVTLILPVNGSYNATSALNLTANLSDATSGVKNATLYIYNLTAGANQLINQTDLIFAAGIVEKSAGIVVTLADGRYNWSYSLFDWAGNKFTGGNNTLTIDTTFPVIDYGTNTAVNKANLSQNWTFVNITLTEINLANITYNIVNNTGTVNQTNYTSAILTINWTNLPDTNYSYWVNVTDLAGNRNSTPVRTITLDKTAPSGNLSAPVNASYLANGTTINFSSNLSDNLGIANATLNIYNQSGLYNSTFANYAAGTLTTSIGIVVNLIDNVYNWFYQLFDWAGNSFLTGNNTLTIDTTFPTLSFVSPTPSSGDGRGEVFEINVSITELNLGNVSIKFSNSVEASCNRSSSSLNNLFSCDNSNATIYNTSATNWVLLFNRTGLVAGTTYYYNVSVSDFALNSNITETRSILGNAAPSFNSVVNSPDVNGTLDPGVNILITVNVSDSEYNMETVMLKWKNSSANWNQANSTRMLNQTSKYNSTNQLSPSTIFNVSFTAYGYEHNLSYMIVAYDSIGAFRNSSVYNLSVLWDCTWNITASGQTYNSFGSVSGYDVLRKYVGNITLTNTGDPQFGEDGCNISVGLSHALTPPSRMCLDGRCYSSSNAINLNARTNYTALINATFYAPSTPTSEAFTVIATNTNVESALAAMNATGTLVTSQAGPYLIQELTSSSSLSVYLTAGNISLDGYLQNVMGSTLPNDTNTAFNVTFNWTLPSDSGLLNVSGNLSRSFGNISDSSYNYNNIQLTFTNLASAVSGTKIIYLYSSGINQTGGNITDANNRTVLSNSVNITFLCYNTSDSVCVTACGNSQDPDCTVATTTTTVTTTSGGGGATGGGGSVAKSEATVELTRGKEQEFELEIKNKYPGAMKKIKISVSGINQEYITIIPNTIDSIPGYSSKKFKVKISAPAYFSGKKYTLYFDIISKLESTTGLTDLSERKVVTLYIFEFSREEADAFVNETQAFIEEMNASGLNIKGISKLLESINTNYADSNFLSIKDNYDKAKEIYANALEANKLISDLTNEMKDAEARGISTIETKKMLYIAEAAFERGDYSLALERLKEARLTFALETKGEFNLAYAIKNNLLESFGILIGLGLFSVGSMLFVRFQIYKRKLRALKEEELLLLELMKILQKECFERSHMSLEEYESAMTQYETRLSETVEERIKIETKVANMLKIKGRRKALDEEKKRLIAMVMKIQDDYLNKGKIETRIYENMIKSYTKRLSEVQEEIATMEAEEAVKRERSVRRMFVIEKN